MFGWFGGSRRREIKQLNRDAPLLVEHTLQSFRAEHIRDIAVMTAEHIRRAHTVYGTAEIDRKRALVDYKTLHKEARRKNDQVALSAVTLVIVHLRAELVDANGSRQCAPARAAIDDFVDEWTADGSDTD